MKSQSEQSLRSVSELDAKCLVKLVSTHYAQQDEELFMKLITAIANCSTFTSNQVLTVVFLIIFFIKPRLKANYCSFFS